MLTEPRPLILLHSIVVNAIPTPLLEPKTYENSPGVNVWLGSYVFRYLRHDEKCTHIKETVRKVLAYLDDETIFAVAVLSL